MAYEPDPRLWEQKDWLYDQYWAQLKPIRQIAEEFGFGRRTIGRALEDNGIPRRTTGWERGNFVSPFVGFYNDDESGTTDELKKQYDPNWEREEKKLNLQREKLRDPAIGAVASGD